MEIQFLGAAETTSGSCYLLSYGAYQVLIDCGLFHGPEELKQRNYGDFPFRPAEIDAVILTHAHIDHSGLLPKLVKQGFSGPIYATGATADLCQVMLADSAYIQEMEVERKNRKLQRRGERLLTPIYTRKDAAATQSHFKRMIYDEEVPILPGLRLRLRDAGHILGAAIVELWVSEGNETLKIVFSGDLGNLNQPIVQDPTFISSADVLVVESTYGTRLHEGRKERFARLGAVVNEIKARGGNLLIPAFAIGRTQDILYALRLLQDQGEIEPQAVYIDSPLAAAATEVFQRHAQVFDYETRSMLREGRSPFEFAGLHYTESVEESIGLNSITGGLIIISASGMADAGRIKHHLKHNLWRKEAGVLLIGHQAYGTLGRFLQDGARQVRIHGEMIQVAASIHTITGFSAHADQKALLNWLKRFSHLGRVFATHGDSASCHAWAAQIRREFDVPAVVPKLDETFDLSKSRPVSIWEKRFHRSLHVPENFSGVVQVMEKGSVLFRGCWGEARKGIKNTFATAFNLGSGSNFLAEAALYNLADQGEISADFAALGRAAAEKVLAETVGRPCREYLESAVLGACGLEQSAYLSLDELPKNAARGYLRSEDGREIENIYAILKQGPGPWLFSTIHDITRFWQCCQEGRFLKAASFKSLLEPYAHPTLRGFYEIKGQAPGARCCLGADLKADVLILVLCNKEEEAESVYNQLAQLSLES